ncbi:NADP-dependent oxidoreductase [Actinacidiphila sp. DG2A-62]|uniref:NADP-dependent oxidoreductase n=1 Tax=Actinacidiphila sp. DG2A-62 TaxID=3108821 RepID=UPI002DBB209B|nr:NADP-dependent oxidoreductase [Actinacidiphila sp. DG2A-62]MEC3993239.1 NADP-dependent oxidoreductase [Actinacidiphila sp. DG2A-62]
MSAAVTGPASTATGRAPTATGPAPVAVTYHQVARPVGMPVADDFARVEHAVPVPTAGTVLVENIYLSVDPYMREAMEEGVWELNAPLEGRAVGRVVAGSAPGLAVGDLVSHRRGWRTHALLAPGEARVLPRGQGVPLRARLGVLGGTGLTAYVGLTRTARLRPGETVFVDSAAGGVGTAVGQFARVLGAARVYGSTGSAAKAEHLVRDLGFDAAFDRHRGPYAEQLAAIAPEGVDVGFENVGGEQLEALIGAMREHGRIAWCGSIAQYNDPHRPPAAPRNLYDLVHKAVRLEGFLVRHHTRLQGELEEFCVPHLRSGRIVPDDTVVPGIDGMVDAFLGVLRGANTGKMIVQVGDPEEK